ncbi:MAG: ATP-binding cassette domain-containing protein [Candidatus Hydrogenedentes bacterium]|nr:ATP-binding cassette domain-containing protein [Candidatus Hydrogenedentota bacterium]
MVVLDKVRRKLGPGVEFYCEEFHAPEASQIALWGPSGCGKSTMLNLISGLLRPSSGVIKIDGIETQGLRSGQLDRLRGERFGFVFQTFNLLGPFTALQNVMLGMRFSDTRPAREWREHATHLLERVGLGHRLHARPGTMSVGERQRVAIARALAAGVMDLLLELCGENKVTLLLVTHDQKIAEHLPNRFDCTGLARETAQ